MSHYNTGGNQGSGRGGYSAYNKPRANDGKPRFNNANAGGFNKYNSGGNGYNNSYNNSYNNYDASNNAGNYNGGYGGGGNYNSSGGGGTGYQQRKPFGSSNPYQSNQQRPTGYSSANKSEGNELWMGDLDPTWTEQSIIGIWKGVGESPTNIKLIRDKITPSKPMYCFVAFPSSQAAATALLKNGISIPGTGRTFKLNWASGGGGASAGPGAGNSMPAATAQLSKSQLNTFQKGAPADQRGRNENSLFIGDLATEVTDQLLFQKFNEKYPAQIRQVKVMIDTSTGVSKGFGFVRFYLPEYQKKALAEMNGAMLGSRPIRVGLAAGSGGAASFASATSSTAHTTAPTVDTKTTSAELAEISRIQLNQAQPTMTQFTDPNNTTLVVKNLAAKFTNDELANHFLSFGDIEHVKLSKDLNSGFVKFVLRSSAESALLFLHGSIINGSHIKVSWGSETPNYERAKKIPLKYGAHHEFNVRLDQREDLAETELFDQSERIPSSQVNTHYVEAKLHRNNMLDSLLY